MAVEKTNSKISIIGSSKISDYEKTLRSLPTTRPIYKRDIESYINKKIQDPVLKQRVLNEVASWPCNSLNYWAKQLDSVIRRTEDKINLEKVSIENLVKLPPKEEIDLDIANLYDEIQNTSDTTTPEDEIKNTSDETTPEEEKNENVSESSSEL